MADTIKAEQTAQTKKFKRDFEKCRELILAINSILIWEKPWYPGLVAGLNTTVFVLFWIWDPSVLSAIASLILCVIAAECVGPKLITYNPEQWTGAKEAAYENICERMTLVLFHGKTVLRNWQQLKANNPKLYYPIVVIGLLTLSWIGNQINNLFLTYILFNVILFAPGLMHHGVLKQINKQLTEKFDDLKSKLNSTKQKNL